MTFTQKIYLGLKTVLTHKLGKNRRKKRMDPLDRSDDPFNTPSCYDIDFTPFELAMRKVPEAATYLGMGVIMSYIMEQTIGQINPLEYGLVATIWFNLFNDHRKNVSIEQLLTDDVIQCATQTAGYALGSRLFY